MLTQQETFKTNNWSTLELKQRKSMFTPLTVKTQRRSDNGLTWVSNRSSRDRDSSSRLENRTEDDMTEDLSFPLCCSFGLVSGGTETPTTHGEQQSKREQGNLTWHLRSPFLVLFDFFFLFCSCWRPKRHRWRLWCMRQAMASFLVPESCVLVMLAAPSV